MRFFADDITLPIVHQRDYRSILEIGAQYGSTTEALLRDENAEVTVIDPCVYCNLQARFGDRITLKKGLSLDVLPLLNEPFDAILVDGDHNWYTVFNELRLIEERNLLARDGVIFLHDVGWPYGRRDLYYDPATIPAEYRHPYAMRGMAPGQSSLLAVGGFNHDHFNAVQEGGPRNGVLTAIEDFMSAARDAWRLVIDRRQFGLGILLHDNTANAEFIQSLRDRVTLNMVTQSATVLDVQAVV